ncbi:hypothetical protein M5K25_010041 [Dendrobium thyrsiflorum]|uniref:Uncharacterized protein n=1 Tax=Dendrobium thyrsiflorum TaxID=117978 RepID=A0ABD0UZS4_DENTH
MWATSATPGWRGLTSSRNPLTSYYGPSNLHRLLRSFRPPSPDYGLSNPHLLPSTVLPTSVTDYSPSDLLR